ncbi:hypothetical protein D9M73_26500 [compost metagenome]|uniref:Uncharacterized protein n=1 Tax=Polaromonas aquatica TaxID=332657 RepID=A0ABW1TWU6_9BURK
MSSSQIITQQWSALVQLYKGLNEFGFSEKISEDGRVKQAEFVSTHFILIVGVDQLMQEISVIWLDPKKRTTIPEPLLGLCYFSKNIETLIARYSSTDLISQHKTTLALYRENPFIISSSSWQSEPSFCRALQAVNEWMWSELRILKLWEFERALHALRTPDADAKAELWNLTL